MITSETRVRRGDARRACDSTSVMLQHIAQGDHVAFADFYDELAPLLLGIVRKIVRDPAMSQEVTQDVFFEIWRLAPQFDPNVGSARSWAATVAHRRAIDRVRSEQSRRARDDAEAKTNDVLGDGVLGDVSESVVEGFEKRRVRHALASLSDLQRDAVTLAYYGDKTYREVAVVLDIAEGTAKTRIRDGLIKMRDVLA